VADAQAVADSTTLCRIKKGKLMDANGRSLKTETILKIAGQLLAWLIMGVWFTAKISTGFESVTKDVLEMKNTIERLSDRMDRHIDKSE
jgi:hypothetical protein